MNIFKHIANGPLKTALHAKEPSTKHPRTNRPDDSSALESFAAYLAAENLASRSVHSSTQTAPTVSSQPHAKLVKGLNRVSAHIDDLRRDGDRIQSFIKHAQHGASMSPRDILVWQSRVYSYSQRIDLASRVVDKSLSTLKTLTQIQV